MSKYSKVNMKYIKKYWLLLSLAFIIRLLVGAFTFHEDVRAPATASFVYLKMHELDPYARSFNIAPQELLNYLPFSYILSLPIHQVGRIFVDPNTEETFLTNQNLLLGKPEMWLYLLYVKAPFIVFDIGIAVLLGLIAEPKYRTKALLLWLFNPLSIWVSSAIGQYDIYLIFFLVLCWYFIRKDKLYWAALALGAGAATKSAPFLILPLLLGLTAYFRERIKLIILSLLPYIITVTPYLISTSFRKDALLAPQMQKIFYANIPLSGGEFILIVPSILLLLYVVYFLRSRTKEDFLRFSILIFLTILTFTHFHIQWFLWVVPFLIIFCLNYWEQEVKWAILGLIISLTGMLFLFESSLQLKLFAPLFPVLEGAKGLHELLEDRQVVFLRSVSASIFFVSSLLLTFKILLPKKI